MEVIGKIIVIAIVLLVGYALVNEYLSKEDVRPMYHLFIGGAIYWVSLPIWLMDVQANSQNTIL